MEDYVMKLLETMYIFTFAAFRRFFFPAFVPLICLLNKVFLVSYLINSVL